jgi:hypothetical protein
VLVVAISLVACGEKAMKRVQAMVSQEELIARGLPEVAWVSNADKRYHRDAQVIAIKRGEAGFYPIYTGATADSLNESEGITPVVREAMLWGSMFGWDTPGADPTTEIGKKLLAALVRAASAGAIEAGV